MVPKAVEEKVRPGSRIRVFEDLGIANVLTLLQESRWAPQLQLKFFNAFLRWIDSAKKVPANGFPHKYEVMPRIYEALKKTERIAHFATDNKNFSHPFMLSNADFNPTNLIFSNDELLVLDWECPCREHPAMVLGHFFLHLTLFADRFPPVFNMHKKRPERCIGEQFQRAIIELFSPGKELLISYQDLILWIATDFLAQFDTAQPPVPPLEKILQRLSGIKNSRL